MLARKRAFTASASSSAAARSRSAFSAFCESVMSSTVRSPLPSGSGTPAKRRVRPSDSSTSPPFSRRSSVAARTTAPICAASSGRTRLRPIAASSSSAPGWVSRNSLVRPQVPAKLRFQSCTEPSGAKIASASNRLSSVAVRVRNRVSRTAESCSCSVRSSASMTRPPSGSGCTTTRRCVPPGSGQASSCISLKANHCTRSRRHSGKSRTSGVRPRSRASARKRSKLVLASTASVPSAKSRRKGRLAKVSRSSASNRATPTESSSSSARVASRKARNSRSTCCCASMSMA